MSGWRWLVVLGGVVVLGALPAVLGAWPVRQSDLPAGDLLARIVQSRNAGYSGYAESSGSLALPVTRQLSSVGDLFGGTTRMRVWWQDPSHWRIDTIAATGESDVHAMPDGNWTWDYESGRATWTGAMPPPGVRLPAAGDLLPTNLARRLLSQARPGEVSRLPARRVAGQSAPGLRLVPQARASTITHVDVWADPASGLPLRVDVSGVGAEGPVLETRFLDFSRRTPSTAATAFTPPRGARLRVEDEPDIAADIDQFTGTTPPDELAGLPRNQALPPFGAIGVYGSGVTEFAAVPLPYGVAYSLTLELGDSAIKTSSGRSTAIGPLSLLLTTPDLTGASWLLTGTVTPATLDTAAAQLARIFR